MTVPMRLILFGAFGALLLDVAVPISVQAEVGLDATAWVSEQRPTRWMSSESSRAAPPVSASSTPAQKPSIATNGQPSQIETAVSTPAPEGTAPSAPALSAITINPLSRMALEELKAFKGRPLFAPSRRPPFMVPTAVETSPRAVPESSALDLRLVGIVTGIDKAVAILGRTTGELPLKVRVGDIIESWHVHVIGPDRVVLRQGEREQTYRIFAAAGGVLRIPPAIRKLAPGSPPPPLGPPPSTAETE